MSLLQFCNNIGLPLLLMGRQAFLTFNADGSDTSKRYHPDKICLQGLLLYSDYLNPRAPFFLGQVKTQGHVENSKIHVCRKETLGYKTELWVWNPFCANGLSVQKELNRLHLWVNDFIVIKTKTRTYCNVVRSLELIRTYGTTK